MVSDDAADRQIALVLAYGEKIVEQGLTRLVRRTGRGSPAESAAAWPTGNLVGFPRLSRSGAQGSRFRSARPTPLIRGPRAGESSGVHFFRVLSSPPT
ncbi:hypothetical protein [Streptomyces capitiformicae]|uniref:Uncharacterized protein n=1 Tax=Streptomyces capitiformicae TaxID=2014920 RepID=A0A919L446_9ACTN|nr:hypothetical protein [Streptomyces capitiformicae]GHH81956.1 hypothetical protein GCM10017771_05160 [Streptomyces capitiformicae]